MKPTQQQIKNLQEYLHKTLSYRETYEEIYDHVLTALEHQPENITYEDAINNIINNDFGGVKNLVKIEKANKSALVSESFNRYCHYFVGYFTFPTVLYTALAGAFTYYCLSHMQLSAMVFEGVLCLLTLVFPAGIALVRLFNTGYFLDTTRKSARDKMFENFAGGPVRLLLGLNIWLYKTSVPHQWFNEHPFAMTGIFLLCGVYCLALQKLYKYEFKTALAR